MLIVALLVSAMIALILGSYLNLNLSSTRLARRSFNTYAGLNLAEAGAEEAVWSFNRVPTVGRTEAWSGWTNNGTAAWRTFSNFEFGAGVTGWAKVYVDRYDPPTAARPKVIIQSSVGGADDVPVMKILEVNLRRRSMFANGLVAKSSVAFSGTNVTVDSWNSNPDGDAATAPVAYSAAVRRDNGSVASTSVLNTAVLINQVDVWGWVSTGGEQPQVGSQGSIRGATTPETLMVDPDRISTDFNADFPTVPVPIDGTPIVTVGATLGTEGETTKWRTPGIVLKGSETLTILGDVTLILTANSGATAISVTGNASLIIPDGSSLTVYATGDVLIAGNGLANANVQPISCRIWGTNETDIGQSIDIAGNGSLTSVVYAPNGDVKINGNGDVMGSIVARSIVLVGNAAFHYDEALADTDGEEPFQIAKWREITGPTDLARYKSLLEGL